METDPRIRAAKGAARLDKVKPDWFTEIDLQELDLACGRDCILGQLYESYATAVMRSPWNRTIRTMAGMGFVKAEDEGMPVYKALTECWTTEIEKRLAERGMLA